MTKEDQFILDELTEQKVWWEKQTKNVRKRRNTMSVNFSRLTGS